MQEVESKVQVAEVDHGERQSEALRLRVRQLRWFLFGFKGRIHRKHFLVGLLAVYGIPGLLYFLVLSLPDSGLWTISRPFRQSAAGDTAETIALVVGGFFLLWVNWAIGLKRFHDFDRSVGTMILLALLGAIPYVGWIPALSPFFIGGTPGYNQYGAGPGWDHASQ